MNKLEKKLVGCKWVETGNAFTAFYNGFGFVVYRVDGVTWLAGLSKKVTEEQLKMHNTKPPKIIGTWTRYHGTDRLFVIPASSEFVAEVLSSAFPELEL